MKYCTLITKLSFKKQRAVTEARGAIAKQIKAYVINWLTEEERAQDCTNASTFLSSPTCALYLLSTNNTIIQSTSRLALTLKQSQTNKQPSKQPTICKEKQKKLKKPEQPYIIDQLELMRTQVFL